MTKVRGARLELFVISLLTLFLELACIRWFPSHVLFLTFFTNTVLLACILGISVGCLAANSKRNFLVYTPLLLILGFASAHLVEWQWQTSNSIIDVGNQASPQMVFFGVEYQARDLSTFVIPIEVLCGYFFLIIALIMVGPGQQLGRSLAKLPNRLEAYTVDIVGSIAGIVLFAACSLLELSPLWWFGLVVAGLAFFIAPVRATGRIGLALASAAVLILAIGPSLIAGADMRQLWSPYYRIDYLPSARLITVNLIGHQQMQSRESPFPAYAIPHVLNRDAGRTPFKRVLIIGAGSGNDVSRALASLLAFVPILFAGVIFAVSFSRVKEADKAFGANIAGAMFGGLAEYSSMLLGFQYLLFVAVALYVISLAGWRSTRSS